MELPAVLTLALDVALQTGWFVAILGGLGIFLARICDVSLGTVRTIYMLRGRRLVASVLAIGEAAIFITAISAVLAGGVTSEPLKVIGYVLGYSTGVFVGMSIEQFIASGWTMLRIVDRENSSEVTERLRAAGEAVTTVLGQGRDGPSPILFVVIRRKRTKRILRLVRDLSPRAFVTVESVGQAINGTIPTPPSLAGRLSGLRMMMRK